jgi:CRP-like cAMP-binding protein
MLNVIDYVYRQSQPATSSLMDTDLLIAELRSRHEFSDADLEKLLPYFEEHHFKKGQLLFRAGDVVKHTYFIQKGIFRQYFLSAEGIERTIYFTQEGNFAGELMSFLFRKPTQFCFQALEDAEVLFMSRDNWESAFTTIPALALYQLKLHAQFIYDLKQEMGKAVSQSPDEKYRKLVKEQPELLQRLPQYQIATFLGITPETLSRIRKRNTLL